MPSTGESVGSDQPKLDKLITLREFAELSRLSQSHLRLLIRKGDICGKKIGFDWLINAQTVNKYLARGRWPGRAFHLI